MPAAAPFRPPPCVALRLPLIRTRAMRIPPPQPLPLVLHLYLPSRTMRHRRDASGSVSPDGALSSAFALIPSQPPPPSAPHPGSDPTPPPPVIPHPPNPSRAKEEVPGEAPPPRVIRRHQLLPPLPLPRLLKIHSKLQHFFRVWNEKDER
jgi:hypothetical protein